MTAHTAHLRQVLGPIDPLLAMTGRYMMIVEALLSVKSSR